MSNLTRSIKICNVFFPSKPTSNSLTKGNDERWVQRFIEKDDFPDFIVAKILKQTEYVIVGV